MWKEDSGMRARVCVSVCVPERGIFAMGIRSLLLLLLPRSASFSYYSRWSNLLCCMHGHQSRIIVETLPLSQLRTDIADRKSWKSAIFKNRNHYFRQDIGGLLIGALVARPNDRLIRRWWCEVFFFRCKYRPDIDIPTITTPCGQTKHKIAWVCIGIGI